MILLIDDNKFLLSVLNKEINAKLRKNAVDTLHSYDDIYNEKYINKYRVVIVGRNTYGKYGDRYTTDIVRDLKEKYKNIKIVVMAGSDACLPFEKMMYDLGVCGFFGYCSSIEELVEDILKIYKNGTKIFSDKVHEQLPLNDKYISILRDYASGMDKDDIAQRNFISISTLNTYINRICKILDVAGFREMLSKVNEEGYLLR